MPELGTRQDGLGQKVRIEEKITSWSVELAACLCVCVSMCVCACVWLQEWVCECGCFSVSGDKIENLRRMDRKYLCRLGPIRFPLITR